MPKPAPCRDTADLFPDLPREPSALERQFLAFHEANPQVYDEIVRRLAALKAAGRKRVGMKLIFEAMRYDHLVYTRGEPWKLNNNYTAFYTRLLQREHPTLAAVVSTRRSKADRMAQA